MVLDPEAAPGKPRPAFDPPPVWDGREAYLRWQRMRLQTRLWSEDSELPDERKGVRLFRAFQGDAAASIAGGISDEPLRSTTGVEDILEVFDNAHKALMDIQKDGNFEKVFYVNSRRGDEQYIADFSRKFTEFIEYEAGVASKLADVTNGKICLS